MSLNQNGLKNDLLSIFRNMTDGDDRYFAREVSAKVADYAESGSITTVDAGTISAGVFAGSGSGSISVESSICENIVYASCQTMEKMTVGGDTYLATQFALGIDTMMLAGEVNTTVSGTVTPPSGTSFPLAGAAKGTFTGVMATLQSGFLAAFNKMATMTSGGDEYLAGQMATVITAYLKAGVIATQGQAALSGSVGAGSMS
jgi:hypothetical protein